jgi:hypothetical protein
MILRFEDCAMLEHGGCTRMAKQCYKRIEALGGVMMLQVECGCLPYLHRAIHYVIWRRQSSGVELEKPQTDAGGHCTIMNCACDARTSPYKLSAWLYSNRLLRRCEAVWQHGFVHPTGPVILNVTPVNHGKLYSMERSIDTGITEKGSQVCRSVIRFLWETSESTTIAPLC